jgi:drug/metabolite transporter (DMT)-like permease
MHQQLTLSSFLMICVFVTVISFGQILLKKGIGGSTLAVDTAVGTLLNIFRVILRPLTLLGLGLYVLGTMIWILVLSRVPLSVAFPMLSMSYFLVVILSATVLHERVNWRLAIVGLLLISGGVSLIGLGMG